MAQTSLRVAERRWLHYISTDMHPSVVNRAIRFRKREHRRLTRHRGKQVLRTTPAEDA